MTDKELLELAAKAAGIEGSWERNPAFIQERWQFIVPYNNHGMMTGIEWSPLTDDGDALRLAVKLGMCVEVLTKRMEPFTRVGAVEEEHRADPARATRRAIVRAAAEIGRRK